MRQEPHGFDVAPKVVPADGESLVTVRGQFDVAKEYEVRYYPTEEIALRSGWPAKDTAVVQPVDGELRIPWFFEGEQEHVFLIHEAGQDWDGAGEVRVYSLEPDLFARRPYKGDTHIHSSCSDGKEPPGHVAGAARRVGFDFMAVTDHRAYEPSLEARQAYEGVEVDLRIYPGEEVHPPESPVHIVNFGGSFSVNALFAAERFRAEVAALQAQIGAVPPGVDPYQYASARWCFDRIREAGGLGVFCHPYWFTDHRYAPSGAITSHLFDTQPFDAFELIGGFYRSEADSNTLQVARYHEERAAGCRIPIVGASDAHGCEVGALFGWYYTIVFAPSPELPDLLGSVKDFYSVAVEALPGEVARAYGPLRLVKYALFLMREVMPGHDEMCREEGELMLQYLAGDGNAADELAGLQGRATAYLERCWGG